MASHKHVAPEKQDRAYLGADDEAPCVHTGCPNEGLNLVRKSTTGFVTDPALHLTSPVDVEMVDVTLCRKHTSKYDRLVVGPGPIS